MKARIRTSAMVLAMAIAGMLALSAAPALAAPEYFGGGDQMQFDPEVIQQMMEIMEEQEGEDYPVPPEEIPINPCLYMDCEEPGDEGDIPEDDSGTPGDNGDNPGFDGGDEDVPERTITPETPETPQQPVVPQTPPPVQSSKLPNTGSGLLLLAAAGVMLIAAATFGRKMAARRTR